MLVPILLTGKFGIFLVLVSIYVCFFVSHETMIWFSRSWSKDLLKLSFAKNLDSLIFTPLTCKRVARKSPIGWTSLHFAVFNWSYKTFSTKNNFTALRLAILLWGTPCFDLPNLKSLKFPFLGVSFSPHVLKVASLFSYVLIWLLNFTKHDNYFAHVDSDE